MPGSLSFFGSIELEPNNEPNPKSEEELGVDGVEVSEDGESNILNNDGEVAGGVCEGAEDSANNEFIPYEESSEQLLLLPAFEEIVCKN